MLKEAEFLAHGRRRDLSQAVIPELAETRGREVRKSDLCNSMAGYDPQVKSLGVRRTLPGGDFGAITRQKVGEGLIMSGSLNDDGFPEVDGPFLFSAPTQSVLS
jgi:hypothetical protein